MMFSKREEVLHLNNLTKALMITVKTIAFFAIYIMSRNSFQDFVLYSSLCGKEGKPQDERGKVGFTRKNAELTV